MMGYYNPYLQQETGANRIMDFCLVSLPRTLDGDTSLVVFVDKLKKVIQIVPCVCLSYASVLA
jgi:hypothetical protein